MKNLTVNMENLTDEQQKQLLALVEEFQKPKDPMAFEHDEKYWYLNSSSATESCILSSSDLDQRRHDFGNAYHTEEQAETAAKAMRRYNRILQFAILHGGYREFDEGGRNWSIYYNNTTKKWVFAYCVPSYEPEKVCMTEECAELLCEKLNSGEFEIY